ncbi:hypothetical protein [Actinomadura bangladeshensis]|uniref:hypothetical protein n=1 Tax=Actinomadura bangladeshensis TaxID=453573 RepID=UPI001A9E22BB|nr:hypothetical protein [Actinomadura bangladeshensis]
MDAYHGVNHTDVLENLAALTADGSYLGALSIPRDSREAALYLDAVEHARAATPSYPSIVNGSISAAVRGQFGDVHFTTRTRGSELFIGYPQRGNPSFGAGRKRGTRQHCGLLVLTV